MNQPRGRVIAVLLCAILATSAGVAAANRPRSNSSESTSAAPNTVPSGHANPRVVTKTRSTAARRATRARVAQSRTLLERDFAILRRPQSAADRGPAERTAIATNGRKLTVKVNEHGLCLESLGGTACGAASTAATVATVAHAVTDEGEEVAGVVPDNVKSVRITTSTGRQLDIAAQDNVFATWLPAPEQSGPIAWITRDGTVIEKIGER
jgi:hypothetical protein